MNFEPDRDSERQIHIQAMTQTLGVVGVPPERIPEVVAFAAGQADLIVAAEESESGRPNIRRQLELVRAAGNLSELVADPEARRRFESAQEETMHYFRRVSELEREAATEFTNNNANFLQANQLSTFIEDRNARRSSGINHGEENFDVDGMMLHMLNNVVLH